MDMETFPQTLQLSYANFYQKSFDVECNTDLLRPRTFTSGHFDNSSSNGCCEIFNHDSLPEVLEKSFVFRYLGSFVDIFYLFIDQSVCRAKAAGWKWDVRRSELFIYLQEQRNTRLSRYLCIQYFIQFEQLIVTWNHSGDKKFLLKHGMGKQKRLLSRVIRTLLTIWKLLSSGKKLHWLTCLQ